MALCGVTEVTAENTQVLRTNATVTVCGAAWMGMRGREMAQQLKH